VRCHAGRLRMWPSAGFPALSQDEVTSEPKIDRLSPRTCSRRQGQLANGGQCRSWSLWTAPATNTRSSRRWRSAASPGAHVAAAGATARKSTRLASHRGLGPSRGDALTATHDVPQADLQAGRRAAPGGSVRDAVLVHVVPTVLVQGLLALGALEDDGRLPLGRRRACPGTWAARSSDEGGDGLPERVLDEPGRQPWNSGEGYTLMTAISAGFPTTIAEALSVAST
jgi:hypothetical protein